MEKIAKMRKEVFVMKDKKYLIPILVVSVLLISGCGKKKNKEKASENTPKAVSETYTEAVQETEEAAEPSVITYSVQLSEKTLSLFEIDGQNKKLVTSMEINPEFYPEEDIAKLEQGIEAYCMEDGYEILENFAN